MEKLDKCERQHELDFSFGCMVCSAVRMPRPTLTKREACPSFAREESNACVVYVAIILAISTSRVSLSGRKCLQNHLTVRPHQRWQARNPSNFQTTRNGEDRRVISTREGVDGCTSMCMCVHARASYNLTCLSFTTVPTSCLYTCMYTCTFALV